MNNEEYYRTVRNVVVVSSQDDRFPTGEYPVYMNYTSTFGILSEQGVFMPLLISCMFGIKWEYINGKQR